MTAITILYQFLKATQILEKYGKVLMENVPKETVALLQKVIQESHDSEYGIYKTSESVGKEEFAHFLAPFSELLVFNSEFLQFLLTVSSVMS